MDKRTQITQITQKGFTIMKHYYFCNTHIGLASGCQKIPIRKGDNVQKIAETWMKDNGYKSCYVYDKNHNFIWNYNL